MSNASLLQDALHDSTNTRQVVIGSGALASVAEVFRQTFLESANIAPIIGDVQQASDRPTRIVLCVG